MYYLSDPLEKQVTVKVIRRFSGIERMLIENTTKEIVQMREATQYLNG